MDSYTIEYFSGSEVIGFSVFSVRWHYQIKCKQSSTRECCSFVYLVNISFSSFSLSVSISVLFPFGPSTFNDALDYVIVFISQLLSRFKNWATLTNHFEKSDFVCISHLFNSRDLFAFSSIHSLALACSFAVFLLRSFCQDFPVIDFRRCFEWNRVFFKILLRVLLRITTCGRCRALSPLFEHNCVFLAQCCLTFHCVVFTGLFKWNWEHAIRVLSKGKNNFASIYHVSGVIRAHTRSHQIWFGTADHEIFSLDFFLSRQAKSIRRF